MVAKFAVSNYVKYFHSVFGWVSNRTPKFPNFQDSDIFGIFFHLRFLVLVVEMRVQLIWLGKIQKNCSLRLFNRFNLHYSPRRQNPPSPDQLGHCDTVSVEEIGSNNVTIFRQTAEKTGITTLLVRASTDNMADDMERAIDDGKLHNQQTKPTCLFFLFWAISNML